MEQVNSLYLLSDCYRDGIKVDQYDRAVLLEMFLEVLAIVGHSQQRGFLNLFFKETKISTFGLKVVETPIRQTAREVLKQKYDLFAEQQIRKAEAPSDIDVLKIIDRAVQSAKPDLPAITASNNRFKNKEFFDPAIAPSAESTDVTTAETNDTRRIEAENDIKNILKTVFEKVNDIICRSHPEEIESAAKNKNEYDFADVRIKIRDYLVAGGSVESLKEDLENNLKSLEEWQKNNVRSKAPPLFYEDAEKITDIEMPASEHESKLRHYFGSFQKWLSLKKRSIWWYLKFFIPAFLILCIILCWAFNIAGIPLNLISLSIIAAVSSAIPLLIIIFIRNWFLNKYALAAQEAIDSVASGISKIDNRFGDTLSGLFTSYIGLHVGTRLSYFYQNLLQSLAARTDFFRQAFSIKKEFCPQTAYDSRLISFAEAPDREKLRQDVEKIVPDFAPELFSEYMDVISAKEVETKLSKIFNKLELKTLRELRSEYPLQAFSAQEVNQLSKQTRDALPLPLLQTKQEIEFLVCSPHCNLENKTIDTLQWKRSEALLYLIFCTEIALEDFNEEIFKNVVNKRAN